MKKALSIVGALALALTPAASFACNLRGVNLSGQVLVRRNFSGCDLRGANLSGANLSGTDLSGAILSTADLRGANLTNAALTFANLSGVRATNLRGCPSSLPNGWVCENNSLIQR